MILNDKSNIAIEHLQVYSNACKCSCFNAIVSRRNHL